MKSTLRKTPLPITILLFSLLSSGFIIHYKLHVCQLLIIIIKQFINLINIQLVTILKDKKNVEKRVDLNDETKILVLLSAGRMGCIEKHFYSLNSA